MIAANGVMARYLEQKGSRTAPRGALAERWERIVALAETLRSLPALPIQGANDFLTAREADPAHSRICRWRSSSCWAGEYAFELPGEPGRAISVSRWATTRTRRRPIGVFPDSSRSASSRRRSRRRRAVSRRGTARAGQPLHRAGRRRAQGRAAGAQVGRRVLLRRDRRDSTRSSPARRQGDLGADRPSRPRRDGRARLRGARRRRSRRWSSSTPTSSAASSTSSG